MSALKTYVDYSQSDVWNVSSTLKLEEDGRFVYEEAWTDYTSASLYGGAAGLWRRDGRLFLFQAEHVEGAMYFPWVVGQELKATEQGRALDFERGWTLRELPERKVSWSGSRDFDAREPKSPAPPIKPPPKSPPPPPPPSVPAFPQFEPVTPSPELAARIGRWIEELPLEGVQNWTGRLCKKNDAIPLHCTQIYLWALRADGQVLSIDHESFAQRAEPENNAVTAYAALAQGAHAYPELAELLAHNPVGVVECERCEGKGWTQAAPPAEGTDSCHWCNDMGWHEPRAQR